MRKVIISAIALATLSGCATGLDKYQSMNNHPEKTALHSGIDKSNWDIKTRPQDDLYRAINGYWLENTKIPDEKSNYGAFTKLDDDAEVQLKTIIEELANKPSQPQGSEAQKIGDLYASFMDEATANRLGLQPIAGELSAIDAIQTKAQLPAAMGRLVRIGVAMPLYPYVHQDAKDATKYVADFMQAGIGLPDRDFYLQDDEKFKSIRAAYVKHIQAMLTLAKIADAEKAAKAIMALETKIATAHWDKVKNRDPVATYNKYLVSDLPKLSPYLDWASYLQQTGLSGEKAVVISQPSFVTGFGAALNEVDLATWKLYLKWQMISSAASSLSQDFVDENFGFFSKTLNGVPQNKPRWKRGVDTVESALGEAVGKIYVQKHFSPEAKKRMLGLVNNLLKAYENSINALTWMGPETKQKAQEKLAKFTVKIGYPDQWRDYSALTIKRDDLAGNLMRAAQFEYARNINKLGKPIDRSEWGMTPQTVNAYYNPEMNEIVFPAAILQPPFFDMNADDAVNYGGIGAVIGHEISHGFDDQGSQYDGDGNLKSWWTAEDRKKFETLTAALAKQYSAYSPIKGYTLNGEFTLGENIADLGGLTIAYKAYQLSLGDKPAPVIDGLSGDQRYFMGWSQVWRRKYREENMISRLKTDPHSPSEFRANGAPVNVPSFYKAFNVKQGDKMYKPEAERLTIW